MADNARGIHVSPGVYSREIDMTYAVKSLGITTLGVVGETLRGPAFQPTHIENWREFTATFGGTSTEKFKGTKYPKYELPYIAKSYLTESKQMEVVRVLGLSGYNAGPAWLITANRKDNNKMVVAVLRSRGTYYKYRKFDESTGTCECPNDIYDSLVYEVGEVKVSADTCNQPVAYNKYALGLGNYNPLYSTGNDCINYTFTGDTEGFELNATNIGRFKISGYTGVHEWWTEPQEARKTDKDYFEYAVSLNANDSDYILNVLGTDPNDGDTPIYVESLYDIALGQCIMNTDETQVDYINSELTFYQVYYPADYDNLKPVSGLLRIPENNLSSKNLGQRFLADNDAANSDDKNDPVITCHPYDYQTNMPIGITLASVSNYGFYRSVKEIYDEAKSALNCSTNKSTIEYSNDFFGYKGDSYPSPYNNTSKYFVVKTPYTFTAATGAEGAEETYKVACAFYVKNNTWASGESINSLTSSTTPITGGTFFDKMKTGGTYNTQGMKDESFRKSKYYYSGVKQIDNNHYVQGDENTDDNDYKLQNHYLEWKYNGNKNQIRCETLQRSSNKVYYTYTDAETQEEINTSITKSVSAKTVNADDIPVFMARNVCYDFDSYVTSTLSSSYFTSGATGISGTPKPNMIITEINYSSESCLYDDSCNKLTAVTDIKSVIEYNKSKLRNSYESDVVEVVKPGQIYTVAQYTDTSGKRNYFYRYYLKCSLPDDGNLTSTTVDNVSLSDRLYYGHNYLSNDTKTKGQPSNEPQTRGVIVKNYEDGLYYRLVTGTSEDKLSVTGDVTYVSCDLNDYKSSYRYASTPWVVSNLKGDYTKIELNKLFRFHTISDGNSSNNEIKISIENIRPDSGCFDVVVRKINDTDASPVVYEKFSQCTLKPGNTKYIAHQIGSYDGMYESRSKYITVEVNENSMVETSIPAGFLGYPQVQFSGTPVVDDAVTNIVGPVIKYNLDFDPNIKNRKQYFGLSDLTGVDIDLFTFKGNTAYIDIPEMLTNGFHLDSRLDMNAYGANKPMVTVDGESGYSFDAVSTNARTSILTDTPVIGTEAMMFGTIYENVNLRKFTMYFYGGFDGWDVYRQQRSNTDDFKLAKYNGSYNKESGEGYAFNRIENPELLGLNQNGITSDWYAYLSAYRQFSNPESVDVNVFATPGIDYVNNKLLAEEVITMLEEERADSIYVVTTPDKPSGADDYVEEIFTPEEVVENLEDTEIDSNYTCTYYPWVKYYDVDNNQYIYLPPTKDVVRNFAQTDNTAYPWFVPAGLERGNVNCVRARFVTKLADEDTLYEGRINPIKTFAGDNGVKVWGQKNMQIEDTQLNRIAVRRLLLRMRKLIAIACRSLIFEQNDNVVRNQFLSIVTPILDNIRSNRGISDYKIEVTDSMDERDCKELNAKIYFKPYCALEYVSLDFILTPQGVDFSNI